ncbi:50S ribosomal protein L13 [Candidatus Cytomitobacter indipagum]|uniref:Large ribosomal subunit protein uL13 n=1 Tax=Candidatus Cytomitobacter indipagum TaxID=2601575 RepID=A0A5C0UEJ2_9PROT|nr:50S ribosomal protein L13 [Candidatus Cytomitobacter indipagum]QEK38179.1 50S ribosomal protein L13 [Candidatus Cytomitobacter indipagum]
MFTFVPKSIDIKNKTWWLIDAKDLVLGRFCTQVASLLRGKHKPIMTPGANCGDFVVVINSDYIALTGKKVENKKFYWHTGYPGGIKHRTIKERLERDSTEIVRTAVKRMLPSGPLGNLQLRNLRIFKDNNHSYDNHKPVVWDFFKDNAKSYKISSKREA